MRVWEYAKKEELGVATASLFMEELHKHPDLLLCAATGSSPIPLYNQLAKIATQNSSLFHHLRLIPLDEWIGLPSLEGSCDEYLQQHLMEPLKIDQGRYLKFDAGNSDLEQECLRIGQLLKQEGPIDLCILGMGKNGHLGFNEPAVKLQPHCHIASLSTESQQHGMIRATVLKPSKGITLGMQDILSSRRIILLISGDGKEEAKQQFFSRTISPKCPASMLWQHNNVDCFVLV
ncbi:galactosamine-6-phosphate isomerase [Flagellimonas flava]|uniref:Galactosamine-6-phosphate isomerase n=1 Tax=Flagellimonas flava TaxID=570519 RepID=A0A1M5IQ71_9FLAO|nr:galactosamine-6-phosphate isomerase [Allomuricauda flava]SHG30179.1 galactosamine-6-phosphate isomerase [Allomuricauda flava]